MPSCFAAELRSLLLEPKSFWDTANGRHLHEPTLGSFARLIFHCFACYPRYCYLVYSNGVSETITGHACVPVKLASFRSSPRPLSTCRPRSIQKFNISRDRLVIA